MLGRVKVRTLSCQTGWRQHHALGWFGSGALENIYTVEQKIPLIFQYHLRQQRFQTHPGFMDHH